MSSKILMYTGATTGVTTSVGQHAFFINENGLPAVKSGSQTIVFSTSGSAFTGSSGSSGQNGTRGSSGSSGVSGTSGQNGAPGDTGAAGSSGSSGRSGTNGINGVDGAAGSSGANGSSGSSGQTFGTSGSSGVSGATGSSGSSGISGTNGATALGAASKGGTIPISGFTETGGGVSAYNVVFAQAYANANYSIVSSFGGSEAPIITTAGVDTNYTNKSATGFTINIPIGSPPDPSYDDVTVDWLTVSQGETGVAGAPGSSGTSGATGSSGVSGTSGTSAPGGGGGDTLQTQEIGVAASQPTITGSAVQWRSIYGNGNGLDQGSGGGYDNFEFGFIQPLFLAPGETIEKVGFYFMDYASSGTAAFKVIICDKHPDAYLPWNLLHSETLTFVQDDVDNKFISWDYDFTNTGSTVNTYFVYILFPAQTTRTFELCRTVESPYLTEDTRLITSGNRYDNNSHWVTGYHTIYNSLPATMSSIIANNLFYNNQRGGHMYYQTSRA